MFSLTLEGITALLLTCGPALASILGCVISFVKTKIMNNAMIKQMSDKFEACEEAIKDRKEYNELKEQYKMALQMNRDLMETNAKLLAQMTKIAIQQGTEQPKTEE